MNAPARTAEAPCSTPMPSGRSRRSLLTGSPGHKLPYEAALQGGLPGALGQRASLPHGVRYNRHGDAISGSWQ